MRASRPNRAITLAVLLSTAPFAWCITRAALAGTAVTSNGASAAPASSTSGAGVTSPSGSTAPTSTDATTPEAEGTEPTGKAHRGKHHGKSRLVGPASLSAASAAAPLGKPVLEVEAAQAQTLDRPLEPIVLRAAALPAWLGSEIASVRAFTLRDGKLVPASFQIDERAADGRYLYPSGIRNDQTEIDGKLTAEDEIVLLASDAGDRPPDGVAVPDAADTQVVSIEEPGDGGGRGWFVLARYDAAPPDDTLVQEPRLWHDWAKNSVFSPSYGIGFYDFAPPAHSAVAREIALRPDTEISPNLLDRFKWRVEISILWGLYTVRFDEENVRVQVLAYKDGPVRVLRFVACRVILPFGIEGPSLRMDTAFYPKMAQIPLTLTVPHSPGFIGTHSDLILGTDLSPAASGMSFYNSENPDGFLIDGWMSEAEKAQRHKPDRWRLWTGKFGTFMERTFWDAAYLHTVKIDYEYVDDTSDIRPPEDHNGQMGAFYERCRVDDLEPGTYHALLEWYFPPWTAYQPGDEAPALAVRDRPLTARIGDWTGPTMSPLPAPIAGPAATPQP